MSGPSAQYQGNPALQQMMLAAAMRGQSGGTGPMMTPAGPAQTVTSEPVNVVPRDSPVKGAPLPDASTFTGPQTPPQAPARSSLSSVNPQQLSSATALLRGAGSAKPAELLPVSADGSKPLADYSHNANDIASNMPTIAPAHHNKIDWQRIAGIVGDALLGASGQPGVYAPAMRERQKMEAEQQFELSKLSLQQHNPREVGHSLIQQGADGKYQTLFSEPEPFESYAQAQGLQPGTPEYADQVKNYRLGAWSDEAVAAKTGFAGYRYDRMGQMQDDRLRTSRRNTDVRVGASTANNMRTTGATTRGQDLSHQDRSAGMNLRHQDHVRQQDMIDSRVRGSASYQGTGGRHGGGAPAMAVGPNGHHIIVQNGRWVDAQTGQPVQ